jgi:hypothetical protein
MKTKKLLRLGVRVPNEGARRLAQWIMQEPVGTLDKLLRKVGIGEITIERMMAGEITPGADIGHQIYAFTRSAVTTVDWYRPPFGGWFEIGSEPMRRAA